MKLLNINALTIILLVSLVFVFCIPSASAQYQLYRWANFEDGKIHKGSMTLGDFPHSSIKVIDFNQLRNMPREFHTGLAANETGRYGLWLKGDPNIWITGLADGVVLDRDKLGMTGRALYQADFFIPSDGLYLPSIAVLAMEPLSPGETTPRSFYRFGLSKNVFLYFSHVVIDEETARIFKQDKAFISKIPRPGWHRFAIVFEGVSNIRCYIDGHEPDFSPVEESSLRKLQVGIMLAERDTTYDCFVDNLSIQWTPEDVPIPDSPFAYTWGGGASPPSGTFLTNIRPSMQTSIPAIQWLDAATAWERCKATQTPMLIYLYAPKIPATLKLNNMFDTNPAAQNFLKRYVLVRMNVNQYQGGHMAKKFGVFKVPTVIIMDTSQRILGQGIFSNMDTWQSFSQKLARK